MVVWCSAWDDEVYEAEFHGRKPRLTKAIFHTFGWSYISLGFFALLTVSYTHLNIEVLFMNSSGFKLVNKKQYLP